MPRNQFTLIIDIRFLGDVLMSYSVRVIRKSDKNHSLIDLALTKKELLKYIVNSYNNGQSLRISGALVSKTDITLIKITKTDLTRDLLLSKAKMNKSRALETGKTVTVSVEWFAAEIGEDVTQQFLLATPKKRTTLFSLLISCIVWITHNLVEICKWVLIGVLSTIVLSYIVA